MATINAGSRILASVLQGAIPLAVIKPSDQSVTSSTTLVNDTALLSAVAANATYLVFCYLDYEGATAGNLKISWSVPASATLRFAQIGQNASRAATVSVTGSDSTAYTFGADGAGTLDALLMHGSLVTSSTSGTFQLQWAQGTSSATATIVHAQSFVALWRIS